MRADMGRGLRLIEKIKRRLHRVECLIEHGSADWKGAFRHCRIHAIAGGIAYLTRKNRSSNENLAT
jgi:hypothetical protein